MAILDELNRALQPTTKRNNSVGTLIPMPQAGGVGGATAAAGNQVGTRRTATRVTPVGTTSAAAQGQDQSALARTQRALGILQAPVQDSRTAAEQVTNPALAESLRLNLNEQQRLQQELRAPGTINPVQFRALQAQLAGNQNAINSGVAAVGGIREANVTQSGNELAAQTSIQRQAMAGAAGVDIANIQAQAALEQQSLANEGRLALATTADPVTAMRLRLLNQTGEQINANGTPAERTRFAFTALDNLSGQGAFAPLGLPTPPVKTTIYDDKGLPREVYLPASDAVAYGLTQLYQQVPEVIGLDQTMVNKYAADIATGKKTIDQVKAEIAADNQPAQPVVPGPYALNPLVSADERARLVNNQTRY